MKQDPAFAQEVERLAGQVVNVSSIADQRTLNQKSDRSHKTVQIKSKNVGQVGDQEIYAHNIEHQGNNFY